MKTSRKAMCFVLLFAAVLTLVGCAGNKNDEPQVITDISQLAGCGIGVVTGSAFDTMTDEYIENADKQYYESYADLAVALSKGKISGFLVDEPVGRMLCNEQKGLRFLDEYISRESYAFAFPKTDEGGVVVMVADASAAAVLFFSMGICMVETFQVPITTMLLVNLFIIALVLAIAAPPVPGGFAVCVTILITQIGIPEAAIPIVIAISMILDFPCTATNLFCLQAELTDLAGGLDMLDIEMLRNDS